MRKAFGTGSCRAVLKVGPKNGGNDEDAPVAESLQLEDLEADLKSRNCSGICQREMTHASNVSHMHATSPVNATITTGPAVADTMRAGHNIASNDHNNSPQNTAIYDLFKPKSPFSNSHNHDIYLHRQESDSSATSGRNMHFRCMSLSLFLILLVGLAACTAILWVGIASVQSSQQAEFDRNVNEVVQTYEQFMSESLLLGLWKHQACREAQESGNPRRSFRRFWEYINASSLGIDSVACAVNVSRDERDGVENETMAFLTSLDERGIQPTGLERNLSSMYYGFKTLQPNRNTGQMTGAVQSEQPFYFPLHYVEPVEASSAILAFDLDSYSILPEAIDIAMSTGMPVSSGRHFLFTINNQTFDYPRFGVTLFHPGIAVKFDDENIEVNRHLAAVSIAFNDVLKRAYRAMNLYNQRMTIVIYDSTNGPSALSWETSDAPLFLGGAILHQDGIVRDDNTSMEFMQEISLEELSNRYQSKRQERGTFQTIQKLTFTSREWTVVVEATNESNSGPNSDIAFIALGAALILVATICLCSLIYSNVRRIRSLNRIKVAVEAEKSAMRLENARKAAQQERDLNDFIAHEVRNPLNAALSANSFVSASVNDVEPLKTEESIRSVREDVQVIDSSLHFINDLLRNMLDMHRAASNQLKIEWAFVDLVRDILEPVASMIYRRGAPFEVLVDCHAIHRNAIVETDPLRLKQIMLNLGRNAAKFVQKGFVRFRTAVIDNEVHLYVEDSGPGVPAEKRNNLFGRFQESLDSLNQGTGIGLALCKDLTELLHGRIWLDESYDSGMPGTPGTCFVVNLRTPPVDGDDDPEVVENIDNSEKEHASRGSLGCSSPEKAGESSQSGESSHPLSVLTGSPVVLSENQELPKGLKVLFVDDDFTLRKLFVRAVNRVAEDWLIEEVSSGETALCKVREQDYDIIFMDMYMASVSKQLTGTETTRELRSRGCKSLICGLSANDMETQFYDAGADDYVMKPFPCRADQLKRELFRIISKNNSVLSASRICTQDGGDDFDDTGATSSLPSSSSLNFSTGHEL